MNSARRVKEEVTNCKKETYFTSPEKEEAHTLYTLQVPLNSFI